MEWWLLSLLVACTLVNLACAVWMAYSVQVVRRAKDGFVLTLETFMKLMEHVNGKGE
jgi:hypothetical protein